MGGSLAVVGNLSRGRQVLHCRLLELFSLKLRVGMGAVLQDTRADLLVGVLLVCDLDPVDRLVFAGWQVHNSELGVISELAHLPLDVVLVILLEDLLGDQVAVWQLEDLGIEILLLPGDEQGDLWLGLILLEDCGGVLWELQSAELLLLELPLLHVDDLGEVIVIGKRGVVEDIGHLLLDRLINLDLLLAGIVVKLRP